MQNKNNKLKILVLHNTLTPYRVALFQALNRCGTHDFNFVFSTKDSEIHKWNFDEHLGFDYSILPTKEIRTRHGTLYFVTDLRMITQKCDLIVFSDHLNIPELTLQVYAKIKKIPVLRWLASTKNSLEGMSKFKLKLKAQLNRMSDGILVPGSAGKEYVVETTHKNDNVFICSNIVENDLYSKARTIPKETIAEIKRDYGLEGTVISFFGQLIDRKGLDVLSEAVNLVNSNHKFSLLFVGDGPLRTELPNQLNGNGKFRYHFSGYIDPKDLPRYYALSDITVLPSYTDTWGMVVNESMAAGVPVICSSGAGAAQDLIRNGESGLVFLKGNARELASAIETMLSSEELRKNMVREADKILENYTVEKARDQFLEAIDKTYASANGKIK